MSTVGMDLSTIFGTGGIQTYTRELLKHVLPLPERPDLLLLTRERKRGILEAMIAGTSGVDIRGVMPHQLALGRHLRPVTEWYKGVQWRRVADEIDLVHFQEPFVFSPAVRRHVTTIHDLFPMQEEVDVPSRDRHGWGERVGRVIESAERILVPSQYTRETIERFFPDQAGKIRVTPLAASDRFLPSPLDRPLDDPYLVWIGRLDPRKNLKRILLAWNQIPSSLRGAHRLVLIGSWSREHVRRSDAELASLLDAEGVVMKSRITEEEHRQLLTHATALVFPSIAEGFGLPAVEAMKCGCPVLTSNTSSLPEVVGDAAVLVDPLSVSDIRQGLEQVMTDASLRDDLRDRGLKRAEMFSWDRTARLTLDVYTEVLQ